MNEEYYYEEYENDEEMDSMWNPEDKKWRKILEKMGLC